MSTPAWINNLNNAALKRDLTLFAASGDISYTEALQILNEVASDLSTTTLSTSLLSDLNTIASNLDNGLSTSSYVDSIFTDLVEGNAANASWTGGSTTTSALGNLVVGSTSAQLTKLTDKWFLGTDLPTPIESYSTVTYALSSLPLYAAGGPSDTDINQRSVGDCFLLASLGEVALCDSSVIESMIQDNGNNTYGVRFYVDGQEEWVTVNNAIPSSSGGEVVENYAASDLWATLVEKAYVQLQASGNVTDNYTAPSTNSYLSIDGGGSPEITLLEITDASKITDYSANGSYTWTWSGTSRIHYSWAPASQTDAFNAMTAALLAGEDVELSTSTYSDTTDSLGHTMLVSDHVFMVTGAFISNGTEELVLRNPWGTQGGGYSGWDTTFTVSLSDALSTYGDTLVLDDVVAGVVVSNGIEAIVTSGVTSSGLTVSGGYVVADYGTISGAGVTNGGLLVVEKGGIASGAVVSSGGDLVVSSGAVVSGAVVSSGGTLTLSTNASVRSSVVSSGGVLSGLVISGSSVLSGVSSGGFVTSGLTVQGGAIWNIDALAGGSVSGLDVQSADSLTLSSGGLASNTVVSGGSLTVFSGGVASGVVVSAGSLSVVSGGTVSGTVVVNSGGVFEDYGTAKTTVISGGTMYLEKGAAARAGVITFSGSGGDLEASSIDLYAFQSAISGFTLGDTIDLGFSASMSSASFSVTGTTATLTENGKTLATINSATQTGYEITTVDSHDLSIVGISNSVGSGQTLVASSGVAYGGMVISTGGLETVMSGGAADGTVISGGTLDLKSGATTKTITFVGSGGVLEIDGTTMPTAVISGFSMGDTIDLTGISATSVTASGSTLLVSETNGGTVTLNLGSPSQSSFKVVSDGSGGSDIVGGNGVTASGTVLTLTTDSYNAVEVLRAGVAAATAFTADLAVFSANASILGNVGIDTLAITDTQADLSRLTLSSVEVLKAGLAAATVFTVNQGDLASGGTVIGASAVSDTLLTADTQLNLTSTTLSGIEVLQAGTTATTLFTVNQADLAAGGSVVGTGADTLLAADNQLNLSSSTLSGVAVLKGSQTATVFTVNQADLASNGSVIGGTGTDSLVAAGAQLDLTSTVLSSIEVLKTGTTASTLLTINQSDLASGGTVIGVNAPVDSLRTMDSRLDLSSTSLSGIGVLLAGVTTTATLFTVNQADLVTGGSVIGSASVADTLLAADTQLDLSATTLSGVAVLQAGKTTTTLFTVNQTDLQAGGLVAGSASTSVADTLLAADTQLDLSSTTLSGVTVLKGSRTVTVFTVDQADLANNGSVIGNGAQDTLVVAGSGLDLTSTTLTSIEVLKAGTTAATVFTVNQSDLTSTGSVIGSAAAADSLVTADSQLNLSYTTLSGIAVLRAGTTAATLFTVNQADLASGGSVVGSASSVILDTLIAADTQLDLSSSTLSGVAVLKGGQAATVFTVNQADLASNGSVIGTVWTDSLVAADTGLDLSSTTLSGIDVLKAGLSSATVFKVNQSDLTSVSSVIGSSVVADSLVTADTQLNLTNITLSGIAVLQAGSTAATLFTVNQADLLPGGSVVGTGADTLIAADSQLNLSSTTLSGVAVLKASQAMTVFTLDQADLASNGSVIGGTGSDSLVAAGTQLDLTSTVLSSIEVLKTGTTASTLLTINQSDLASGGTVIGVNAPVDSLRTMDSRLDLSSTSLSGIGVLLAGVATTATVFTVNQADLITGGSVIGSGLVADTLLAADTQLDLSSTSLSGVAVLQAGTTATVFRVNQSDLLSGGSVIGSSVVADSLVTEDTQLDLSSTTLSGVAVLIGHRTVTVFTVDQADLASNGSVIGNGVQDTLVTAASRLDLTSTTLTSIEVLKAGTTGATLFKVNQSDLAAAGSVIGSALGVTSLVTADSQLNLSATTLSNVAVLQAGTTVATVFTVNQADLAAGGSVVGSASTTILDSLIAADTRLDLSSTTLSGVAVLMSNSWATACTFTVNQADLASNGSVIGGILTDSLVAAGAGLDLSSTTLSSIDVLKAQSSLATVFTVNQADLASGGSVVGSALVDSLVATGTILDLSSTSLSGIEVLRTGSTATTLFTVNQADLVSGGSVVGGGGDTLATADTQLNLTSTTLSGIEFLQAASGSTKVTVFTLSSLASVGEIDGNGSDSLVVAGASLDLSSVTLAGVSVVRAGSDAATTITGAGAGNGSGASNHGVTIIGGAGNDTLTAGIGNDTLVGGGGNDTLDIGNGGVVGSGKAIYFSQASSTSEDTVNGFRHLVDKVEVYSPNFSNPTSDAAGKLLASEFCKAGDGATISGASGSKVYFIFDTSNNTLYYNASGATGGVIGSANPSLTALASFAFAGTTANFTAADIRLTSTRIT